MVAEMIYDRYPQAYDRLLSPFENRFLSEWREEIVSFLPPAGPIIEIGAGTGLNFKHYSDISHLVATDISLAMLRRAHHRDSQVRLVQTDACRLPFEENSFSSAIGTLILCSVKDPNGVFSELRRVVVNGGSIVFLEHVRPEGILGRIFDFMNPGTTFLFDDHINRRTPELLADFGFQVTGLKKKAAGVFNLIQCRNSK